LMHSDQSCAARGFSYKNVDPKTRPIDVGKNGHTPD
jgi:hypothetical protein